jgi:3-oxoacyl-[acyl-carrier protein] reductase
MSGSGASASGRPVALITGAAAGIGAATAETFARRGYDVAVSDLNAPALSEVVARIRAIGRAEALPGDLADFQFVDGLVPWTLKTLGRIDVLVNNAAWRELTTMREISRESWERTLRVCVTAPAFLARAAAEEMGRRQRGVIVNVSSINAERAAGVSPAYVAAKGAIESLTAELAVLYGPSGVRVIAVRPGAVDTALSGAFAKVDAIRQWSNQLIPLGRWATADEIARAIAMLCSDDAAYITGTCVTIDGGWTRALYPDSIRKQMLPERPQ